jgi:hypothetical protein
MDTPHVRVAVRRRTEVFLSSSHRRNGACPSHGARRRLPPSTTSGRGGATRRRRSRRAWRGVGNPFKKCSTRDKWIARFLAGCELTDRSRRPHRSPSATAKTLEEAIVAARRSARARPSSNVMGSWFLVAGDGPRLFRFSVNATVGAVC